jgi:YVTN family beta-propeller protein
MTAQAQSPVFVLNSLDGNVSVIDPVTWTEKKRIPTGKEPHHLYLTPDEKSVIVANAMSDSLTFIDPRTAQVQRTVTGILDPYHLRFSPDMKWLVTAANRLNHVDIYRWDGHNPTLAKRIQPARPPATCGSTAKAPPPGFPCRTAMSSSRLTWPSKPSNLARRLAHASGRVWHAG